MINLEDFRRILDYNVDDEADDLLGGGGQQNADIGEVGMDDDDEGEDDEDDDDQ